MSEVSEGSVVVNIAPDGVVFTLDFRPRQASQAAAIVGLFERAGAALADTRVSVAGSTGSKRRYSRICRDISKDVRVEVKAVQVWQPCRMQYPYDEPRTQSASMGRLRKYCYTAGEFLDQSSAGLWRSFLRRAWGPVIGSLRLSFTNFTSLSYRESPAICYLRGDKPRRNRCCYPCAWLWPEMSAHHRNILPAPGPSGSRVRGEEGPPPKKKRTNVRVTCNSCHAKKASASHPATRFPYVASSPLTTGSLLQPV